MTAYVGGIVPSCRQQNDFAYLSDALEQFEVDYWPPHVSQFTRAIASASYAVNLPVSQDNIRNHPGSNVPHYSRDLYHRVHVIPPRINVGTISSTQQRNVEVWNAYLTSQALSEVQESETTGMTLTGPLDPPTTFGALESRIYMISVTKLGPPTIAGLYTFVFPSDLRTLQIIGRRVVPFSLRANWEDGIRENLEWRTEVLESRAAFEQRIGLRQYPRRGFDMSHVAEQDRDRVLLENTLIAGQSAGFAIPIDIDQVRTSNPLSVGATVISVDTTDRDFAVDQLLMLRFVLPSMTRSEVQEIASFDDSSIAIKSPLTQDWPIGTHVIPMRLAHVQIEDLEVRYVSSAVAVADLQWSLDSGMQLQPIEEPETYRDIPVFLDAHNWVDGLDSNWTRKVNILDTEIGVRVYDDLATFASRQRQHRFTLRGKSSIVAFRRWLQARRGKLTPFWLPSRLRDMQLAVTIQADDLALSVENRGYAVNADQAQGRRDIMIWTRAGARYYRRIIGASDLGATESIAIDQALGVVVAPADVRMICFMALTRLGSDRIEIEHKSQGLAEAIVPFQTIKDSL